MSEYLKTKRRLDELKAAVAAKEKRGDSLCGMTEALRKEIWRIENGR